MHLSSLLVLWYPFEFVSCLVDVSRLLSVPRLIFDQCFWYLSEYNDSNITGSSPSNSCCLSDLLRIFVYLFVAFLFQLQIDSSETIRIRFFIFLKQWHHWLFRHSFGILDVPTFLLNDFYLVDQLFFRHILKVYRLFRLYVFFLFSYSFCQISVVCDKSIFIYLWSISRTLYFYWFVH